MYTITNWTNTGGTRYFKGQHKTRRLGGGMLRPSPYHGTQRQPNDYDDGCQLSRLFIYIDKNDAVGCYSKTKFVTHHYSN